MAKDYKRIIPGLIISAISLIVVIYLAKPGRLYEALKLADLKLILIGILIALLWIWIRSIAWRTLLQEKATLRQVFFAVNEGYLLNNVLPFRLGEVARAFLLGVKANLSFWQVFPTVIIERILDLALAAGLLLAAVPFVIGADWARQAAYATILLVIVGVTGLYILARNRNLAISLVDKLGNRWAWVRKFGGQSLNAFFDGLSVITDWQHFLLALFWFVINWGVSVLLYSVFLRAYIPDIKWLWVIFVLGAASFGIAAPSSPGAVGVFELVVVGALGLFGVDAAQALAFALTIHITQYLLVGILGSIGLAQDGESLVSLYSRVRRIER